MTNDLPLPSDLQHLIEKRSGEERRGPTAEPGDADGSDTATAPPKKANTATDSTPDGDERRKTIRRHEDQ